MLGFWRNYKSGRRGVVAANSTPSAAAVSRVEGEFGQPRETVHHQRTTADVTRPASLRGPRSGSIRSATVDEICTEKVNTAATATGLLRDRSVQTSDELLQPLIGDGLRRRRGPLPPAGDNASSPVHRGDSLDDLMGGGCRPWRRHSLSSMSPLSSRLASPLDDAYPVLPPGDLNLDEALGNRGVVSPLSLSPLSVAEMTSPPRRRRAFELPAPAGAAYPLRCYDAENGQRWGGRPPSYASPNYTVGLPPSPQPARATAAAPQRAPLRRQKPYVGAIKTPSGGSGRRRGVAADVEMSPVSSKSSGAGRDVGDDGGDSSEAGGAKSLSTVSLEDAISRSISRLSDDDNAVGRRRRAGLPPPGVAPRGIARNDVTRNDVTGTGRPSVVTSRRPTRAVVLSSDV